MAPKSIENPQPTESSLSTSGSASFSPIDQWLLQKIYRSVGQPRIRIALENGPEVSPADGRAVGRVIVRNRQTLFDLILDPEVGFGEAYSDGRITVEGDLAATLEETERSLSGLDAKSWYSRLVSRCLAYAQRNSVRGARVNIHRHYDLDNNFFRLWLDPQLVYSCAYFPAASMSLEEAQVAKMDYVSRKLNLQPEERVVDVGSGWGALALHMAEHYGVSVRGFSISHEQVVWSRRRAKELGLDHRVEFIEDDYRNISGKCDAIVSVGMLEHVGAENYGEMGRVIDRTLGACGRGLMHSIGRNQPKSFNNWTSENIFPGAYAPTLRQMMNLFEPWQFSILDVENLRPHYARTLQFWLKRFEDAARAVCDKFGPEFVNTWRLYLAGAVAGFRAGTLQLFQIIFARKAYRGIPATRAHLYREELRKGQIASPFLSDGSSSQPPVRPSQLPEPVAPLVESTH